MCILCFLTVFGCSKNDPNASSASSGETITSQSGQASDIRLRSTQLSETIRSFLSSTGWIVKDTTAQNLGIFTDHEPAALFTARSDGGAVVFLSWFESEEAAKEAYATLLPNDESVMKIENGANFQQALVMLPDDNGIWLFRQVGGNVFGAWAGELASEENLNNLLNAFQVSEAEEAALASSKTSASSKSAASSDNE